MAWLAFVDPVTLRTEVLGAGGGICSLGLSYICDNKVTSFTDLSCEHSPTSIGWSNVTTEVDETHLAMFKLLTASRRSS